MSDETLSAPLVPERLGPYRIESRLGGGMGVVYRAHDARLDRTVAIKYFRAQSFDTDDLRARFRREARAVAQLNHPTIVQIFDFVQQDECDWIVMEYVRGRTLERLLRPGPLELASALPILREIAWGLASAHAKGVVHRDVKSDNVMIAEGGHVKILDFGLARRTRADHPQDTALTREGMILGTPHAMSPEQASGLALDPRSDIFSLGTLFYETLSGRSPFRVNNPVQSLMRVLTHVQEPALSIRPEIPEELSRLIDRMLEKEPERRPASVEEIARFLDRLVGLEISSYITLSPRSKIAVEESANPQVPSPQAGERGRGERRRITLLFGEIVGPGVRDPLNFYVQRPALWALVDEVLEHFGGTAGPRFDHAFVALFGYPEASRDDARRAVMAARQMARRLPEAAADQSVAERRVALRLGLHTGSVAVSPAGGEMALGESGDIAAELARRAAPGAVLVSGTTHTRVAAFFECVHDLDPWLDDFSAPVEIFKIQGERG